MPFIGKNFKIFLLGFALVFLTACGNEEGPRSVTAEENVSVVTESNGTETSGFEDNATQIPETNTTVDQNSTDETGNTTEENTADEGNTTIPDADITPPVITLNGEANITLNQGEVYIEPGATASDKRDGNVDVEISGTVDTSKAGTYTITYTATDSAGNQAEVTRSVRVIVSTLQLQSLNLEINVSTLNLGEQASLSVTGNYKDNTSKDLTDQAVWIITPQGSVEINGTTLTALKDTNVTLQAKIGTLVSNTLNLDIYWEVNGYKLPPEPDPAVNNSTLLGIDSNNNDVRDDVERWIYQTYDHPIERGIFMQSARAYQKVIVDPSKAHETTLYIDNAYSCQKYWLNANQELHDKYDYIYPTKQLSKVQFNTIKRHMAYERYNGEFNGEVFSAPEANKSKCLFDENGILKDL